LKSFPKPNGGTRQRIPHAVDNEADIRQRQTAERSYKCPMTKDGFFKKYEYVYDEYYDCVLCPNDQVLKYSTTNREGYRSTRATRKSAPAAYEGAMHRKQTYPKRW
jgi:hypothetical protein